MNTPTPWMLESNEGRYEWRVANKDYVVAWMQVLPAHDDDKANAALIVRAVNSHQALIDALEFYADPKRYEGPNMPPIPDDKYDPRAPDSCYVHDITKDSGAIAKDALKLAKGEA